MVQVTGARIASRVKRLFGDESGVQVTNNDIIDWLNDAMVEAAVQNGSVNLKRATLASVANVNIATFPDAVNVSGIHSVAYRSSSSAAYIPLTFVSPNSFEELFPEWQNGGITGSPCFYTTDDFGKFKVYPAPDTSEAAAYSIVYNAFFADYTDLNAVMSISPRYFQYLLEYCLMKAYEMDENWEAVDRKASFIQSTLNSLSTDDVNMNQVKYPVISSRPEDM